MEELIVLGKLEEEYLLRALESALQIRNLRQLFLWARGEMQGLLPHAILTCIQFDEHDAVRRLECLHNTSHASATIKLLTHPSDGLAIRIAQQCRANGNRPRILDQRVAVAKHPLAELYSEVLRLNLDNALAHGTERLCDGASFFVLFSLAEPPTMRHAFCFDLLLPSLHLAFQRILSSEGDKSQASASGLDDPLTVRESEILRWITKGKSKDEISVILEISPVTVKNHIHKIYKKLKVHNRVQAVLRCHSLRLLNPEKS